MLSICIISPSKYGKTQWARSLGPHIYFNGCCIFATADWVSSTYLVVDDVEWEFFKCKKQLLGGQLTFNTSEKYKPLFNVTFGKPVIYLVNTDPRQSMTQEEEDYYKDNVVYITLHNKLF